MIVAEEDWFDLDRLRTKLASWVCSNPFCEQPRLGAVPLFVLEPPDSANFARVQCRSCGKWIEWAPKPRRPDEAKTKRRRRRVNRLDDDSCVHCGVTAAELAAIGQRLEEAHLIDRAAQVDAGVAVDERTIPYCPSCHSDQHRKRELRAREHEIGRVRV